MSPIWSRGKKPLAKARQARNTYAFAVSNRGASRYSTASVSVQTSGNEDFFRYTSGRWLWDEEERLQQRYKRFNVDGLQKIAASSVGGRRCVSMVKLAEGGFNKIFRLTIDNGSVVIARIPYSNAGPLPQTIASEVATMDLASKILKIPVPKVLDWSSESDNLAQTQYILMEEATGKPLSSIWHSLDVDAKSGIVDELVSVAKKLLSVSFSRYGNIYFSDALLPGCERIIAQGSLPAKLKAEVEDRYVIGPVVERSFWEGERQDMAGIRGPWTTPQAYVRAIVDREISWLSQHADPTKEAPRPFQSKAQNAPDAHISLYRKLSKAVDSILPTDPDLMRSTLWHWDLHAPNIFVTDNKITGVIDWQDCWAGPLMLQGWRPRLVEFRGTPVFQLPPHYKSLEEGEEKQKICSDVEKSILLFSYESQMQHKDSALHRIFRLPQIPTIRETILYAANTWDGGLIPLRECLFRLQRNWNEICPGQKCPFMFTEDELSTHMEEGKDWDEKADFWSSIDFVARDGFVANEDYRRAFDLFAGLREEGLRVLEGDERAEFDIATKWAAR